MAESSSVFDYEPAHDADAPPAFSDVVHDLDERRPDGNSSARVTDDGRINITFNEKARVLSTLFGSAIQAQAREAEQEAAPAYEASSSHPIAAARTTTDSSLNFAALQVDEKAPPALNIVIQVVGSRGDVQPFVALGQELKNKYGHRVRIATHPVFKTFVEEEAGLEFFSIGGDPAQLMAYMVKHPGLMPSFAALTKGRVSERRRITYVMLEGCWRSCIEPAEDSIISKKPFIADAIIANPPSFAHIHCAQKLSIPLHIMFTMPWTFTQSFPHPLANIESTNLESGQINLFSYLMVEMIIWQGLRGVINRFRGKVLGMEPISLASGVTLLARQRIPHTYCWSPSLVPKPKDWGKDTSVVGFYFLKAPSHYMPDPALTEFLASGPAPIYIGFGSIVVKNPEAMTTLILDAVTKSGQRALISKGWGNFGSRAASSSSRVHFLGNVPHDWLFQKVTCVVHHGGAGTTAAGIAAGKPTVVVPFFGDQHFWGDMIARAGAGPRPIPKAKLSAENLSAAILEALKPEKLERANLLSQKIAREQGCDVGAKVFHEKLPLDKLRCPLVEDATVVWKTKKSNTQLSAVAAAVLIDRKLLKLNDLRLLRHHKYNLDHGAHEPISGQFVEMYRVLATIFKALADIPIGGYSAVKATKATLSAHTDQDAGQSGTSTLRSKSSNSINRQPASRPSLEKSHTMQVLSHNQTTGPPALSRHMSAPPDYSLEESEDEFESNLAIAELPAGAAYVVDLDTHSSQTITNSQPSDDNVPEHSGSSEPGDDQASIKTSSTRNGFKYVGSAVVGTGKGISKSIGRLTAESARAPLQSLVHLAYGFHNVPRLWGDEVRQVDRITGAGSGLKAAGKELGFGLYDGLTGLVTQPIKGAKEEGFVGFGKGLFKGSMGVAFKPASSLTGLFGYTADGIVKQCRNFGYTNVKDFVRASRLAQGFEEMQQTSSEKQAEIVLRWNNMQSDRKRKGKKKVESLQTMSEEDRSTRVTNIE